MVFRPNDPIDALEATLIERARALLPDGIWTGALAGAEETGHDLARFALAFAEALPGLYRECESNCDEAVRVHRGHGRVVPDCLCGAGEQCARLDALADKLGIPPEQRRKP